MKCFWNLETFAAVRDSWKTKGSKLRQLADEMLKAVKVADKILPEQLESHGSLFCSIVKEVHFKEPGFCKPEGKFTHPGVQRIGRHAYHVVDFGDVFFRRSPMSARSKDSHDAACRIGLAQRRRLYRCRSYQQRLASHISIPGYF